MKTAKRPLIANSWDGFSEARKELEFRRSAESFEYFTSHYFAIKVPARGQKPFVMREAQRDTAQIWLNDRFSITLKARQIGFSTLVNAVSAWLTWFHPDREVILLSKTGQDARKLKEGISYAWRALPESFRKRIGGIKRDTIDTFELANGSVIRSLNSNNPARGYSAYMIFVDEAAHFEKWDAAWAAIEPAGDVGGRIHILSTATGVGNGFHRMWVEAVTKVSNFKPIFHSWRAGDRDDAWYEDKRRGMPDWQLHQEYPSTPEEAFIRSGRPVFAIDDDWEGIDIAEPMVQGFLDGFRVVEDPEGPLCVWAKPEKGDRYVIGADVASGMSHGDFSVCHVVNTRSGEVVARWRGHLETDEFAEVVVTLGRLYNTALINWEANSMGDSLTQYFKRMRYPALYKRVNTSERYDNKVEKLGFHTNSVTKPTVIEDLRASLKDGLVVLHDAATLGELRTYVRLDDRGKMGGQPFDDCVMALALAVAARRWYASVDPQYIRPIEGTFAELHQQLARKNRSSWVIGGRCTSARMPHAVGQRR